MTIYVRSAETAATVNLEEHLYSDVTLLCPRCVVYFLSGGLKMGDEDSSGIFCYFQRDLMVGLAGADVSCLQQYLKKEGHFKTNPTGYFGTATEEALSSWQVHLLLSISFRLSFRHARSWRSSNVQLLTRANNICQRVDTFTPIDLLQILSA